MIPSPRRRRFALGALWLGMSLASCGPGGSAPLSMTPADIEVSPLPLDFGEVVMHGSSTLPIVVKNVGQGAGQVTVHPPAGSGAAVFSVSPLGAFTLPGGAQQTISVTFSPVTAPSSDSALLSIEGPAAPAVIALQGMGFMSGLEITPNPLDFNFVQPGETRTLPLRITNIGGVAIDLLSATITADDGGASPYSLAPVATGSIAPGDSVELDITFAPPACVGAAYNGADLVIVTSFEGQPETTTLPLSGYAGGAVISCTPLALQIACGAPSSLPIICTNTGSDAWSVTSNPPGFCQAVGPDGGSGSAGQSLQVEVQCSCPPNYDGGNTAATGSIVIGPDACGTSQTITFAVSADCSCG